MIDENFLETIFQSIMEIESADVVDAFNKAENKKDFPLMGTGSILDSMDLVSLVVTLEGKAKQINPSSFLISDSAMSSTISPFRSPRSILNFLMDQN